MGKFKLSDCFVSKSCIVEAVHREPYGHLKAALEAKLTEETVLRRWHHRTLAARNKAARQHISPRTPPTEQDSELVGAKAVESPLPPMLEPVVAPLRPLVRFGKGFLFLARSYPSHTYSTGLDHVLRPRPLFSGRLEVYHAPGLSEGQSGSVIAQMCVEETNLQDPQPLSVGSMVVLSPLGKSARIVDDADLSSEANSAEAGIIPSAMESKSQIAELLQEQTGVPSSELLQDDWLSVEIASDESTRKVCLWPRSLCFSLLDSAANREHSTHTHSAEATVLHSGKQETYRYRHIDVAHIPVMDLLGQTASMLHQPTESKFSIPLIKDDLKRSLSPSGQDSKLGVVRISPSTTQDLASTMDASATQPEEADDSNTIADDDDLFGSEGSPPEEEAHLQPAILPRTESHSPHQQAPSLRDDNELYGLITDDDFAFFDDPEAADISGMDFEPQNTSTESRHEAKIEKDIAEAHKDTDEHMEDVTDATMANGTSFTEGSGIPTDPSSMPGLTPHSLTDESPAAGGPLDPRTPSSPYYEAHSLTARLAGVGQSQREWQPVIESHSPDVKTDAANGDPRHLTLPPPKSIDIADKYSSGRFAVPDSLASGIAGGGRRLRSAPPVEPAPGNKLAPSAVRKFLQGTADDEVSEIGTADTASDMSEDEADEDESIDEEEAEEERLKLQQARERLLDSLSTTRDVITSWQSSKTYSSSSLTAEKVLPGDLEEMVETSESADLVSFRDGWIDMLLNNSFMLKLALEDGPYQAAYSSLRPMDVIDALESCDAGGVASTRPSGQIEILEPPQVAVACQSAVIHLAPTALPFWQKLGLSAVGGRRNVTALLLHLAGKSDAWREEANLWLKRMQAVFQTLGLGRHDLIDGVMLELEEGSIPGLAQTVQRVMESPDRREETLLSILSRIKSCLGPDEHVVIYAIGEQVRPHDLTACLTMQSFLRELAKEEAGAWSEHIHVRSLPWSSTAAFEPSTQPFLGSLHRHAFSIYRSLHVNLEQVSIRDLHPTLSPSPPRSLRLPVFALVPSTKVEDLVSFRFDEDKSVSAATGRLALLHVAYDLGTQAGDLVCMSLIDDAGCGGIMKCRRRKADLKEALRDIWNIVVEEISHIPLRWQIVLCKASPMTATELQAWQSLEPEFKAGPCLEVILACRDDSTSILFQTHREVILRSAPTVKKQGPLPVEDQIFHDATQASFAIYPDHRLQVGPSVDKDLPLLSLRSSIVVTTRRGSQDACISTESGDRSDSSVKATSDGTHVAMLHLLASFPGRLVENHLQSRVTQEPAETLRRITTSLHHLCLLTQEFELDHGLESSSRGCRGMATTPWPFAVLERIRPALSKFESKDVSAARTGTKERMGSRTDSELAIGALSEAGGDSRRASRVMKED